MQEDFYTVLEQIQQYISREYSTLLENKDNKELLESYILHYIEKQQLTLAGYTDETLLQRILSEMTEFSFLSAYLKQDEIEEININAWDDISLHFVDGKVEKSKEKFQNPKHAVDVVRRMIRESNMTWDNSQPIIVGHLKGNVRITAVGFDLVDEVRGLSVSIRKVNPKNFKKDDFITFKTATQEMLDFLSEIYIHGVSMCFTGATNSGKTTLMSWILSTLPYHKRLLSIEHGTREFECTVKDENGETLNNVVHLSTRHSDDESQNITQEKLLETIMTKNPDYIVVGESKGDEAMQTINAANTGHAVITTTHANSCADTYFRFISLCKLKYPSMDEKLLKLLAVRAFPIVVFTKRLEDNSRKILQINEAFCHENGDIEYNILYKYVISSTAVKNGKTVIDGYFKKVNPPSVFLKTYLIDNGLSTEKIQKIFKGE